MLGLNDPLDTFGAEYVSAGRDHRVVQVLKTDWAIFPRFDANLQHILQGLAVLGCKVHDLLRLQGRKNGGYTLTA